LQLLYGPSLRSLFLPLVFVSLLLTAGCGGLNPISLLTGGGPNIAANVDAAVGQEASNNTGVTSTVRPQVRADNNAGTIRQDTSETKVENKEGGTVNITEVSPLMFITLIMLFIFWSYFLYLLPSPDQIWKKKKNI
jgi:hypothetical protein